MTDNTGQKKYYIGDCIADVRLLHANVLSVPHGELSISRLLALQAENIVAGHRIGNEAVVFHLTCWCPGLIGQSAEKIMQGDLTLLQAQQTIAREHGFTEWDAVPVGDVVDVQFEDAVDSMLQGDYDGLYQRLNENAPLARQTSAFGHRATLLHYLGANGVETHRQMSPYNAAVMAELLLQHGADVNAQANIYGRSDARQLVATSIHPAEAGVTEDLLQVLDKYDCN